MSSSNQPLGFTLTITPLGNWALALFFSLTQREAATFLRQRCTLTSQIICSFLCLWSWWRLLMQLSRWLWNWLVSSRLKLSGVWSTLPIWAVLVLLLHLDGESLEDGQLVFIILWEFLGNVGTSFDGHTVPLQEGITPVYWCFVFLRRGVLYPSFNELLIHQIPVVVIRDLSKKLNFECPFAIFVLGTVTSCTLYF